VRAIAFAIAIAFAPSAWATCPGYRTNHGWKHGNEVTIDISGVPDFYTQAALDAFANWSVANATENDSHVIFVVARAGQYADYHVRVGSIGDNEDGTPIGGLTQIIPDPAAADPHIVVRAFTTIDSDRFGMLGDRKGFFTKLLMHEIGHTMGLDHIFNGCGNKGVTVMNMACDIRKNDMEHVFPTDASQPCDVNAVKNDRRQPPLPPVTPGPPNNVFPDPGCALCGPPGGGNGPRLCEELTACTGVYDDPLTCEQRWLCDSLGGPFKNGRTVCAGFVATAKSASVCGSWRRIAPTPDMTGDYACMDVSIPLSVPSCEEIGLHSEQSICNECGQSCAHTTFDAVGLSCWSCPGTTPPPNPDPNGGPCVAQTSCGFSTGEGCRWVPDGCGGQHLCGTCGSSCVPGYDAAGNPIIDCGGSGDGPPTCTGAHNETCYPSFKACSEECCGVCERRIGCGGESAHKCFEP